MNPDFALIHVQRCDAYGNAQIDGLPFMDLDLALAANRVILTTERIVSNDQIRRRPDHTKIPFFSVDAVVEVPFGSAPHECYGLYEPLFRHLDGYAAQLRHGSRGGHARLSGSLFLRPEILDRISRSPSGLEELLDAARRGASIYDD